MRSILILFLIFLYQSAAAQQFIQHADIGDFKQAAAFYINPSGFIYVTDQETNEVYKLDTLGNQLKSVGGYGWNPEAFDNPVDIFATTLNVYVADKNNDRIQIFDKDLNFLSVFKTKEADGLEYEFAYPTSCGLSPQGDLFILDSDNSRILKYDLNGNFLTEIGSYDAGKFALNAPKKFDISGNGKIFVLDQDAVKVFDSFGNGVTMLKTSIEKVNLNVESKYLTLNSESEIIVRNIVHSEEVIKFSPNVPGNIVEALYKGSRLYVLTDSRIIIYKEFK
jgi:DNA-binding beta-propeller fold protein YncE